MEWCRSSVNKRGLSKRFGLQQSSHEYFDPVCTLKLSICNLGHLYITLINIQLPYRSYPLYCHIQDPGSQKQSTLYYNHSAVLTLQHSSFYSKIIINNKSIHPFRLFLGNHKLFSAKACYPQLVNWLGTFIVR